MKQKIIRSSLTIVVPAVLFLIAGCASKKPLAAAQADFPKEKVDARGLFNENCATCHGQDGRAKTFHGRLVGAQNLTNAKFQAEVTDDQIVDAIKTGPKAMPAFEKKLSQSEIEALVAYVRTFNPPLSGTTAK